MKAIPEIIVKQKEYFKSGKTKSVAFRISILKALKEELEANEQAVFNALKLDFKKSEFETYLSEYSMVMSQLNLVIKNLKKWAKPQRVSSSLLLFPAHSFIYKEPYGSVLIISPWNYPFILALEPLILAIAAGNTVVLKPSELTENTSRLISNLVKNVFPEGLATSIVGGVDVATALLNQRWDYIFFTGSVSVGKIIAQAAAKHLTPVTLELGGKSPCIIDDTVDLKLTAKRVVWGKFLNAGQTCIAPDYILVKKQIKADFTKALIEEIKQAYGNDIKASEDFPRIINEKNTQRLANMLNQETISFGGEIDKTTCYIAPTLLDNPDLDSPVMQEEIFGPILPILTFETEQDIESVISQYEKPLAFYVFSNNKAFSKGLIERFSFGGGVINDTLMHFGNDKLPFGGVGFSGMGNYHGKFGFDTFSHHKAIVNRKNWIDPPVRYAPYQGKLKWLKLFFKYFT
ncbi:aldehyde dehydrogenase family protein [Algibacter wandonensis]|uniref:Aldehyde dehydrogenase n=1 Tax=Algibacter lectus TaxID=221126 RepID=A0A4R8MCW6_9FLAO|nr:aldehyde dehydrogenase [Algibacter lectus]MWW23680.1 aldehyde dehydrogenase family protein [Algibacter lectus]TDY63639.1 aldehyde dehydrogenase (NAD+) [Algibacter lectus]